MAKKDKQILKFGQCTTNVLFERFGLHIVEPRLPMLLEWIEKAQVHTPIPAVKIEFVEELRKRLKTRGGSMKEKELFTKFINPILSLFTFYGDKYDIFSERTLSYKFENFTLKGYPDWMLCYGIDAPEAPFMFIHAYKSRKGIEVDTLAQLVAAMYAAQLNNQQRGEPFSSFPMIGATVIQSVWSFGVLIGNEYSFTKGYDANDPNELRIIYNMLKYAANLAKEKFEAVTLVLNK